MINSVAKKVKEVRYNQKKAIRFKKIVKGNNNDILNDRLFLGNNIEDCFAHRKSPVDRKLIKRIIRAYKTAKQDQAQKDQQYQVGNEWLPLYSRYMSEIATALQDEDVEKVALIYENFMRDNCSVGLHGMPDDMHKYYFNGRISELNRQLYLYDAIYRYRLWQQLTDNSYSEADLQMPDTGNAYGYFVNNHFVRSGAEYMHYYQVEINKLLNNVVNGKRVITELGGGYGGLAYFINHNIENKTYIDFDLPENMALTACFLLSAFPDKKVLLYGEQNLAEVNITEYDIVIMPNFEISKLKQGSVDVVFNSYSLAEMSKESIDTYISELTKACRMYFFHVNHNKYSNSYIADDFGIEKHGFELVNKKPALWNLGRNADMDEFEYLYKRNRDF